MLDPEVLADPYPLYHRLRTRGPRALGSASCTSWVVTRYEDVVRVLRDFSARRAPTAEQLTELGLEALNPVAKVMVKQMLFLDPPEHARIRSLASAAFTPQRVAALRSHIRDIVTDLLAKVRRKGRINVIADLAEPLPCIVTAEMLGVPVDDRHQLKLWSQDFAEVLGNFQHNPDRVQPNSEDHGRNERLIFGPICARTIASGWIGELAEERGNRRRASDGRRSHRQLHYYDGRRTGNHDESNR